MPFIPCTSGSSRCGGPPPAPRPSPPPRPRRSSTPRTTSWARAGVLFSWDRWASTTVRAPPSTAVQASSAPRLVGQVAPVAQNAGLEVVRVGAGLHPLHVVVGLGHQEIRPPDAAEHRPGHIAQVGDHRRLPPPGGQGVAHALRRVVGGGEALNRQPADGKALPPGATGRSSSSRKAMR